MSIKQWCQYLRFTICDKLFAISYIMRHYILKMDKVNICMFSKSQQHYNVLKHSRLRFCIHCSFQFLFRLSLEYTKYHFDFYNMNKTNDKSIEFRNLFRFNTITIKITKSKPAWTIDLLFPIYRDTISTLITNYMVLIQIKTGASHGSIFTE